LITSSVSIGSVAMSKAVDEQWEHLQRVALLIQYAGFIGVKLTGGDAYRDARAFGVYGKSKVCKGKKVYGAKSSFHKLRKANDFNLFINEHFATTTIEHKQLGEFWEFIGGTWGGRFRNPDGNHYSSGESR